MEVACGLFIASAVIAGLYLAQDVLIPIAVAVLLSFILSPLVNWLENRRLGRTLSVLIASILAFAVFAGMTLVIVNQLVDLASKLPSYRGNIENKLHSVRGATGSAFSNVERTILQLSGELNPAPPSPPVNTGRATPEPPTPVEVVNTVPSIWSITSSAVSALLSPLGRAAIIALFVIFMLIFKEDARERIIRVAGPSQMYLTTEALTEASARISRYLLAQLCVNVTYGLLVALGLYFIGVPNAILWGIMLTVLRFLPYLGFWIAAAMPFALSFLQPGWWAPIATAGLYCGLEMITNYIEPQLYGASTGLSSIAVLVAAVFWVWLWGGVGLLLSTPLTALFVVLGKYIPSLHLFNVMLGDEPALESYARLYQRLLANNLQEARKVLSDAASKMPLVKVFDSNVIPLLCRTEVDFHRKRLSDAQHKTMIAAIRQLVTEIMESHDSAPPPPPPEDHGNAPAALSKVLCLPAQDEAAELVCEMLKHILRTSDLIVEVVPETLLASEMSALAQSESVKAICISAMPPAAARHARYLCKRIRGRVQVKPQIVALWGQKLDKRIAAQKAGCRPGDSLVFTIEEAVFEIRQQAGLAVQKEQAARRKSASVSTRSQRRLPAPEVPAANSKTIQQ